MVRFTWGFRRWVEKAKIDYLALWTGVDITVKPTCIVLDISAWKSVYRISEFTADIVLLQTEMTNYAMRPQVIYYLQN